MEKLTQQVNELTKFIIAGNFMEALDQLYSSDVITHENENPPVVGLENYRISAKEFMNNISNYSVTLKNIIVSDGISAFEWHYIFDHTLWGHWDKTQLSVQRWKDGKIVNERHYYS